ncbi:hypothetical protein KS4_13200 [Poriferisphaera corsica]|uniref:Glycosyl hydrolase-like 10 domain-containing protein n=1 Tax=Poriferisphaera corsica TaxID=2528020 RepID=A0A517YSS9_9BACT|nr:family 10 glycosylhydrolase [Poriferisphaera corsica]QDU33274.1 hypothetical protein KS4_13200 [Poriferisphaera corsica]
MKFSILSQFLLSIVVFALVCTATASILNAADIQSEVRGTWLTTTANNNIETPSATARSMRRLKDLGLNTVYVEVWKNGYTQFPSNTMHELIGVERKPELMPGKQGPSQREMAGRPRDLLSETLIHAHRNGLVYIAWFEYGFMAAYKDSHPELRKQYSEWLTLTKEGKQVSRQNQFVWMNPLRPESRNLLLNIIKESVIRYDLDGVQLDDRIAWPTSMGYDPYTQKIYAQEHNGKLPPANEHDPEWIAWRSKKVTEFAEDFYRELKTIRPNLIVSISPAVYPWSFEHYACDWKAWSDQGLMDEFVPQAYRTSFSSFKPTWEEQVATAGKRKSDLIAGLRVVGTGAPTSWPDMKKKIQQVRDSGAAGHCYWFSKAVLELYPEQIAAFYKDSPVAKHPKLPADWRPGSIALKRDGRYWKGSVPADANYRIIVQHGTVWAEQDIRAFEAGPISLSDIKADAVELLVDRR